MSFEEFIDNGPLYVLARLMTVSIVFVELFILAAHSVEHGVARFGRHDVILKPDVDNNGARYFIGK